LLTAEQKCAGATAQIIWQVLRDQRSYQNEPPVQNAAV